MTTFADKIIEKPCDHTYKQTMYLLNTVFLKCIYCEDGKIHKLSSMMNCNI